MSISVRFRALTSKKIPHRFDSTILRQAVAEYIEDFMNEVVDEVMVYPPEPEGSKYIRTGTLGRSWVTSVHDTKSAISGYISNSAANKFGQVYSGFVQGHEQMGIHASTGWKNVFDYLERKAYVRGLKIVVLDNMDI